MADQRREDVVGTDGTLELGTQLHQLLEVAAAVAEHAFVDRREQRRAHREEQERDRADDGDAVVEHGLTFDHPGVGGRVQEQQQQRAPHGQLQTGAVRRDQRHRHHVEEHQEEERAR